MKKKLIILGSVILAILLVAAGILMLILSGNDKLPSLPDTSEEVRLGTAYELAQTLTAQDGTQYIVEQAEVYRNSDGKVALQIYGLFDVDDVLGYKIMRKVKYGTSLYN